MLNSKGGQNWTAELLSLIMGKKRNKEQVQEELIERLEEELAESKAALRHCQNLLGDMQERADELDTVMEAVPPHHGSLCSAYQPIGREIKEGGKGRDRAGLIQKLSTKWVNGSLITYSFMGDWREDWKTRVYAGFAEWAKICGLRFQHVDSGGMLRIGNVLGDGSWSYIGRDSLHVPGPGERTMNLGWDIMDDYGWTTVLHEIGHALGFPHEHQNPRAGIVWNREKVIADLSGPPNYWSVSSIEHNVLNKLNPALIRSSDWDADSIMHYAIQAGWINEPSQYRDGIKPPYHLSSRDKEMAAEFYPKEQVDETSSSKLVDTSITEFSLKPGEQVNIPVLASKSGTYGIETKGRADTVIVLQDGAGNTLAADDDSGYSRNALLERVELTKAREYTLRLRLYGSDDSGSTAVVMWKD